MKRGRKVALGGAGLFGALAAWVVFSTGERLPPPSLPSPDVEVEVDWDAVGAEATRILSQLLAIPSVNPPGNEEPAARYLASVLEAEGIPHEVIRTAPGRALLVARLEGKADGGALCLGNHIDVVPAVPKAWSDPSWPFSGAIVDGKVYGRGALDMKGFAVMQLMTLVLIKRLELPLERDLVYLALPDEEGGGEAGAGWVASQRPDLLEGVEAMWNEGGMGLKASANNSRPVFGLCHAERGACWVELSCKGPGGHGSTAHPGNAPQRLFEAVSRILSEDEEMVISPITERMFAEMGAVAPGAKGFVLQRLGNPLVQALVDDRFQGDRFLRAVTRNTRNLTVWQMGGKVNVVPPEGLARIDIRLLPGVNPEATLKELRELVADLEVEVTPIQLQPGSESPVGTPLFDIIRSTLARLHPEAVTAPLLSPGGTDAASFRPLGIDCYGLIPALFDEQEMRGFHGPDEHIRVEALKTGARATFEASFNFCRRPLGEG